MKQNRERVVLITGASAGIGLACATHLHRQGFRVYGASRRAATGAGDQGSFEMIQMDVTDDTSVAQGVAALMEKEGRLDVLVNNAGNGIAGSIEDTTIEEAKYQFETNFFGTMRLCRAALPIMRKQGSGHIVNVSSVGGIISIPFQAMYSASKFAVEGLTEALRMEVKAFGIQVSMIEPGDFKTEFTANRVKTEASHHNQAYLERLNASLAVMEADEQGGPSPDKIGKLLQRIIESPSPRLRYPVGTPSGSVILLKKLLPARLFEWAMMKNYKLH